MTAFQKWQFERAISALESKIACYSRLMSGAQDRANVDAADGCRESLGFNQGQVFTLDYVIQDLEIILSGMKFNEEDSHDEN